MILPPEPIKSQSARTLSWAFMVMVVSVAVLIGCWITVRRKLIEKFKGFDEIEMVDDDKKPLKVMVDKEKSKEDAPLIKSTESYS